MQALRNHRLLIATLLVIVLGIGIIYISYKYFHQTPDNTTFRSGHLSFTYPRTYDAKEYAPGVVSIGHLNGEVLIPNVEVDEYKSDPDVATPGSFDTFVKLQAAALCGADGSLESISCTQVGVTPYTSVKGLTGQTLNLTLVRKNLKTGTTTSSTYGPMYVFNTTASSTGATSTPQASLRYSAVFIYPSLQAFVDQGTTTPELLHEIVDTLTTNSK